MSKKSRTPATTTPVAPSSEFTMGLEGFTRSSRVNKGTSKYPIDQLLTAEDGFFVPLGNRKAGSIRGSLTQAAKSQGKRLSINAGTLNGVEGLAVTLAAE